jgi:hypothetical protein
VRIPATICYGGSYTENGFNIVGATSNRVDTNVVLNIYGCDSVIILSLTVRDKVDTVLIPATICYGGSYTAKGFNESMSGDYPRTDPNIYGCDSVTILTLTVRLKDTVRLADTICYGGSYTDKGFNVNTSGDHSISAPNIYGCDSVTILTLTVRPQIIDSFTRILCDGDTYVFNGDTLSKAGTYYDTVPSTLTGCDSVIMVKIALEGDTFPVIASRCYGESYFNSDYDITVPGNTSVGTDTSCFNVTNDDGCIVVVKVILTTYPKVDTVPFFDTVCYGVNYTLHGFNIACATTVDSVYYNNDKDTNGCDSVTMLSLHVYPKVDTVRIADTICYGESYTDKGFNVNTSGDHSISVPNIYGCDSVTVLTLTIRSKDTVFFNDTISYGEDYTEHGFNILSATFDSIYYNVDKNIYGCDSVTMLTLVVYPKDTLYTCVYGGVYGLADSMLPVKIYYSTAGSTLSYVLSESVAVDGVAVWSLCGVAVGSHLSIFAESLEGYSVVESYNEVLIDDTLRGMDFHYRSLDTALFLCGNISGLPDIGGVEILYSVNSSLYTVHTDISGDYCINVSIGDNVRIIAGIVIDYTVTPQMYSFNVDSLSSDVSYDFVYMKSHVPLEADSVYIVSITVDGVSQVVSDTVHYVLPCGSALGSVDVVFTVSADDTVFGYAGTGNDREYRYTVDLSRNAVYHADAVVIETTASSSVATGGLRHTYYIAVEKRFEFYDIVTEYVDNVLFVNNNPLTNGGYSFVQYEWYRDDVLVGIDQDYSAGFTGLLSDNPFAVYRVEMLTDEGVPLRTCADVSGTTVDYSSIYPNPVPAGGSVHFTNVKLLERYTHAVLYSSSGVVMWEGVPSGLSSLGLTVPARSGTYVLVLSGSSRGDVVRYKLIIK